MFTVNDFTNDNFKVLAYLYDIKNISNKAFVTQQEIADDLGLSRVTANRIIRNLRDGGYIEQDKSHVGRYIITSHGLLAVETIRGVNK